MELINLIHELRGSDFAIIHGVSAKGEYQFAQLAKYCKVSASDAFVDYVASRGADHVYLPGHPLYVAPVDGADDTEL
jgi:hypothetical protein